MHINRSKVCVSGQNMSNSYLDLSQRTTDGTDPNIYKYSEDAGGHRQKKKKKKKKKKNLNNMKDTKQLQTKDVTAGGGENQSPHT